jgi:mannan endo-1,4-beta-mannosidase
MVVHSWGPFQKYAIQFHSCDSCKEQFQAHVRFIVGRTNQYTGKRYADDPAVMAWEIANEPRAFGKENIPVYEKWIRDTAAQIKSLDQHHLVTPGTEGKAGCEGSLELF